MATGRGPLLRCGTSVDTSYSCFSFSGVFCADDSRWLIVAGVSLGICCAPAAHPDLAGYGAADVAHHAPMVRDLATEQPGPPGLGVSAHQMPAHGALDRRVIGDDGGDALGYQHRPVVHDVVCVVLPVVAAPGSLGDSGSACDQRAEELSAVLHDDAPFRAMARRVAGSTVMRAW